MRGLRLLRGAAFLCIAQMIFVLISCSSSTSPGGGGGGEATVWFVDLNGSGAGTGEDWGDAFTSLQAAVDAAGPGEQIWVMEGTFTPGSAGKSTPVLALAEGVEVYGGFEGTETSLSDRDLGSGLTTLDGGGNVYHVVIGADGAVLDGFVVTGGNADGTGDDGRGGGVFMSGISMTVSRCTITGNEAYTGAGIYAYADDSLIESTDLEYNTAVYAEGHENGGGGLAAAGDSKTRIDDCYFYNNTSGRYGGALEVLESGVTVTGCSFVDNSITLANSNGGCVYVDNDGFSTRVPSFTGCDFEGNSGGYGGAVFFNDCLATVISCTFTGNTAGNGGGAIECYFASLDLRHSVFSSNEAASGGAVYFNHPLTGSPLDVFNCLFEQNSASGNGGAMVVANASPNITSCTFAYNSGVAVGGVDVSTEAHPVLTNCILWGNTSSYGGTQIDVNGTGYPVIQNCCIDQAGYSAEGNSIRSDPLWVSGPDGEYYLSQEASGEPSTSPCVDAGIDLAASYQLDVLTTRTDEAGDTGTVDIGFHYPIIPAGLR